MGTKVWTRSGLGAAVAVTGVPAAKATVTLPLGGPGATVTVAWPSDVNGPVRLGNVGDGVS